MKERGCRPRWPAKHRRGVRSKAVQVSGAHRAHVIPTHIAERRDRLQLISRPIDWHSIRAAKTHGARSIRNRNCASSERHIVGARRKGIARRRVANLVLRATVQYSTVGILLYFEVRPCDPCARVRPCVPCVPCVAPPGVFLPVLYSYRSVSQSV